MKVRDGAASPGRVPGRAWLARHSTALDGADWHTADGWALSGGLAGGNMCLVSAPAAALRVGWGLWHSPPQRTRPEAWGAVLGQPLTAGPPGMLAGPAAPPKAAEGCGGNSGLQPLAALQTSPTPPPSGSTVRARTLRGLPCGGGEGGRDVGEGPRGALVPFPLWARPQVLREEDSCHSGGINNPIYYFY